MGVIDLHRVDYVVHRPALERVHRRCPSMIQMPELRITFSKPNLSVVLENKRDTAVSDAGYFRRAAVHHSEAPFVACPADLVPGPKVHDIHPVHLDPAMPSPTMSGHRPTFPPLLSTSWTILV